ncbi:putative baseplate hub protein [Proteus phage VTCCBPA139]|nr:putative baseplate hub protein [Proteus phage VTCCBPA139]
MKEVLPSAREYLTDPDSNIKVASLLMMELPSAGGTPQYVHYTDYPRDLVFNNIPYLSGKLKSVSAHRQDTKLTVGNITFTLSGVDSDEVFRLVRDGVSFIDRQVTIYQAIIKPDGTILPVDSETNGPILFFSGKITAGSIKEGQGEGNSSASTSSIVWTCANEFYDFEQVNGRLTDDATHRGLEIIDGKLVATNSAKKDEYKEDLGFFHSNKSVTILAKYQTQEKRYRMKTKKRLFGLSKSYSLEEYYETVTKEIDIDFNLTAKFIPVVYGVQHIPGIPVFADTLKDDPNIVYVVYAFAEGEIDGFLDFAFGDTPMICYDDKDSEDRTCFGRKRFAGDTMHRLASGIPTTSPTVHGEKYEYDDGNGDITMWVYHGKSDQEASKVLVDIAAKEGFLLQSELEHKEGYWDSRFRLLDTAYAVVRFTINENRTDIPEVSATIQGKKVRVYNSDGTFDDSKTSLNPVWQLVDYMRSPIYGAGIPLSKIPIDFTLRTAKLLDTIDTSYESDWLSYWRYIGWTNQSAENRQMIQTNVILETSTSVFKNIESMLEAFSGALNNFAGEYRITTESYDSNPRKLHFTDTIGNLELQDVTARNKYNSVQASIIDPGLGWKTNSVSFFNSEFKRGDRGLDKRMNLSFAYITNYYCARSVAARELKRSRYARELKLTVPYYMLGIEVNDAIAFTYDRYGWKDKYFLVKTVSNTIGGKIELTLIERDKSVFINSEQVEQDTSTPPTWETLVTPPRSLEYVPYIDKPLNPDNVIGKNGDLRWKPSTTSSIIYYTVKISGEVDPRIVTNNGESLDSYIVMELKGMAPDTYTIEVRAVDMYGRRSSPAVLVVDINAAVNLNKVQNLTLLNRAPNSLNEWIGKDVLAKWDRISEEVNNEIPDLFYRFQVLHPTNHETIYDGKTTNGNRHIFTYADNRKEYGIREGTPGVYRNLDVRVRAEGINGESSVQWTYIDD